MHLLSVLLLAACAPLSADTTPVGLDAPVEDKAILGSSGIAGPAFNFQAAVFDGAGTYVCAAIVLDESWVLTVGGCAREGSLVGVGAPNLTAMVQLPIDEVLRVENLELVHVTTGTLTDYAQPATLVDIPSGDALSSPGTMAAITGWGGSDPSAPQISLKRADVPILDDAVCDGFREDETSLFCAGYLGFEAADVCNDRGAPLSVEHEGDQLVLGLAAIEACGSSTEPSLYVDLAQHIDLIRHHVPDARVISTEPTGDDHGDSIDDATPLFQRISLSVDGDLDPGDTDVFSFVVDTAQTVVIETESDIDTVGTLLDAAGTVIATDDDGGPDRNFEITADLEPGAYFVQVQGWRGTQQGSYVLAIEGTVTDPQPDPDPGPAECADPGPEPNDTRLTASPLVDRALGQVVSHDSPDWWEVEVPAGQQVRVDLSFTHADGDIDLGWWSESMEDLSNSSTDDESLVISNPSSEDITGMVEVYMFQTDSALCHTYDLEVSDTCALTDAAEPNDTDAFSVFADTAYRNLTIGGGDVDRYSMILGWEDPDVTVRIRHASTVSDLSVEIYKDGELERYVDTIGNNSEVFTLESTGVFTDVEYEFVVLSDAPDAPCQTYEIDFPEGGCMPCQGD